MSEQVIEWLKEYQLSLMEWLSEDIWCAGWMSGLEENMWNGPVSDYSVSVKCRAIAEVTEVWFVWNEGDPNDESDWRREVPLDEWKEANARKERS